MGEKRKLIAIKNLTDNMQKDHISESAAQCAYYVILSFIPFVILLLTLIQYTSIEQQQLVDMITNIIPSNMNEIIIGIIREVYSKSIGTISISILFTLLSADRGLFALTRELHLIYEFTHEKKRSWIYLRLISLLETITFIVLITLGLVIFVFGKSIISTIKEQFGGFQNYTIISSIITQSIFLLISFLLFLCMYQFMSRNRLNFKGQIRGAAFAAIALSIVSLLFSRYLDIFRGFSIMYGSLTKLMLVMMWTYTCFYIIFLGAEINKFYNIDEKE